MTEKCAYTKSRDKEEKLEQREAQRTCEPLDAGYVHASSSYLSEGIRICGCVCVSHMANKTSQTDGRQGTTVNCCGHVDQAWALSPPAGSIPLNFGIITLRQGWKCYSTEFLSSHLLFPISPFHLGLVFPKSHLELAF